MQVTGPCQLGRLSSLHGDQNADKGHDALFKIIVYLCGVQCIHSHSIWRSNEASVYAKYRLAIVGRVITDSLRCGKDVTVTNSFGVASARSRWSVVSRTPWCVRRYSYRSGRGQQHSSWPHQKWMRTLTVWLHSRLWPHSFSFRIKMSLY